MTKCLSTDASNPIDWLKNDERIDDKHIKIYLVSIPEIMQKFAHYHSVEFQISRFCGNLHIFLRFKVVKKSLETTCWHYSRQLRNELVLMS